jgi:salicylate hydroxylase
MLHPDRGTRGESYDLPGSVDQMRADFSGWEPRYVRLATGRLFIDPSGSVEKLLGLVSHTLIWPLLDRDPLDSWVHPSGHVALLGDACHPMLVRCFHSQKP